MYLFKAIAVGSVIGARNLTYQTASDNSFIPTDWLPFVASSPLGTQWHILYSPYTQMNYQLASNFSLLARIGYDIQVGPDYQGLTAESLSGAIFQVGLKLMLSGD